MGLQPGKTLKDYAAYKDFYRPNMLVLTNCKKVLINSLTQCGLKKIETTSFVSPKWVPQVIKFSDLDGG